MSSWLILLFINGSYILISMLFNLLLASIAVLLRFFFLFLVVFNSYFTIPVRTKNERLKIAFTIPTHAPVKVENDAIGMLTVLTDKIINDLSK